MDLFFVTISLVFILFLFISYFIGIIKLSSPLILIYLVFCFSYLINQDSLKKVIPDNDNIIDVDKDKYVLEDYDKDINNKENLNSKIFPINDFEKEKINDISNPVVSFNPKPIIIDSNLIIQRNKEKIKYDNSNLNKDEVEITKEINNDNLNSLKLKEIMICRGVYKRNPIKPGFKFTNDVDSLFCYTKISNIGSKQEIKHVWYYQDKLITSVVYNIKTSYNYRSWSKKNIFPRQIGMWRVDIIDSKGHLLGSREFEISSLNDLY